MVLLLENGHVFLYVSEILYVRRSDAHLFSCWEQTYILNPTSRLSQRRKPGGISLVHTLYEALLQSPWLQVNSESKASSAWLSWIAPFRDCHPKCSQAKPYTDTLETLY